MHEHIRQRFCRTKFRSSSGKKFASVVFAIVSYTGFGSRAFDKPEMQQESHDGGKRFTKLISLTTKDVVVWAVSFNLETLPEKSGLVGGSDMQAISIDFKTSIFRNAGLTTDLLMVAFVLAMSQLYLGE